MSFKGRWVAALPGAVGGGASRGRWVAAWAAARQGHLGHAAARWKRSGCSRTHGGARACTSASMPLWLRTTLRAAQLLLLKAPGFARAPFLVLGAVLSDRNIQHHVCGGGGGGGSGRS